MTAVLLQGNPAELAALEARVVVDAHAGEQGDLFALQARHPPTVVMCGQS